MPSFFSSILEMKTFAFISLMFFACWTRTSHSLKCVRVWATIETGLCRGQRFSTFCAEDANSAEVKVPVSTFPFMIDREINV